MNTHSPTSKGNTLAAVLGLLILALALRPAIVSIGPVLLQIQQHFQLSYAQASLLTSIPDVCMALFALLAPGIARRFGADRTVIAALILLGAATLLRALSDSTAALLSSTVLVGVGIAIGGALIGGWIKTHFAHRASFFMGIYAAGLSVGATVAAVSTEFFAQLGGSWRLGAGVWAVLCVAAVLSWRILATRFATAKPAAAPVAPVKPIGLPWSQPKAWLIALYFGLSQFIVYALFAWLAPAATEWHVASISPGALLGLFTSVFAVASFAMGSLAGRSNDRRVWLAIATALTAAGLAGLYAQTGLIIAVMLIAVGLGMAFTLAMTLPLDNVHSAAEANTWTVLMLFVGYLIAATGPIVFGYLRDHTGGYALSCLLLLVVSLLMLALTPLLKPQSAAVAVPAGASRA
ncbi:MFS transporter [Pseudomonas sp. SZMC_28357]|uniref:MFS transporter n=1 Tax=Pseudomonas sp. SZMC_28357 TaxID=3074380 RepID=UPI002870BE58|nr:MFS transporter [Pseudomonas sp. SZMC_28357]MDR9754264.1 MFS transporter [Pseudomonas sp. SZMC_28357]